MLGMLLMIINDFLNLYFNDSRPYYVEFLMLNIFIPYNFIPFFYITYNYILNDNNKRLSICW